MVVFYFVSPRIRRSLVYGKAPRNRLDLYLPPAKAHNGGHADAVPVVVYITGALAAPRNCQQGCTQTKLSFLCTSSTTAWANTWLHLV